MAGMEQQRALKDLEGVISLLCDHASALLGKLEGLLFRAQRMAHAGKDNIGVGDMMFGYDLRNFRQELRNFSQEIDALSARIGMMARTAVFEESAVACAQAVMRLVERLHRAVVALHDQALLAHQHIRRTEYKMEAWYLVQESDNLESLSQGLPASANKLIIRVSTASEATE